MPHDVSRLPERKTITFEFGGWSAINKHGEARNEVVAARRNYETEKEMFVKLYYNYTPVCSIFPRGLPRQSKKGQILERNSRGTSATW